MNTFKWIVLLCVLGFSSPAWALRVSSLVVFLNVENCGEKRGDACRTKQFIQQGPGKGYVKIVLARYVQSRSGERKYEEALKGDKLYSKFKLDGAEFNEPFLLEANKRLDYVLSGTDDSKRLKSGDAAVAMIVKSANKEMAEKDPGKVSGIKMGVDLSFSMVVRLDITGIKDQGRLKITPAGEEIVAGKLFKKFTAENKKSAPAVLEVSGVIRENGKRLDATKEIVLFQTMIPDYLAGKTGFSLSIGPGATVDLYVPVNNEKTNSNKTIAIIGREKDGKRVSSKAVPLAGP